MKIAFVVQAFESMASEMLSSMAKQKGHEIKVFFDPGLFNDSFFFNGMLAKIFDEKKKVIADLMRWEPDLVCMSVLTDTYAWAHDMAKRIKSFSDVPIIMGGDHATAVPGPLLEDPYIDYVVQGEGEFAFMEFLENLENKSTPADVANLWYKVDGEIKHTPMRPLNRDLDSLPFADKTIYDHTFVPNLGVYTIMAARGCPYRCTYCNESINKRAYGDETGSFWRPRGVDNVIEELEKGKREGRVKYVNFYDPIFAANIRWLREFAPKYRSKIGVPFIACTHPGHVTEEYVALLKEAGCIKVDVGVQSVNADVRKKLLHRYESNEQTINAIERFMKAGIYLHCENIVNLPGQTDESFRELVRFYNQHRPNTIKIFGLRLLPGTDMEEMAAEMGLVDKDFIAKNARCENNIRAIYRGGQWPSGDLWKFQLVASLIPVLPPESVEYILEKKLYKYFPRNPGYFTLIVRAFTAQKWQDDIAKRSYISRYTHYTLKKAKDMLLGQGAN